MHQADILNHHIVVVSNPVLQGISKKRSNCIEDVVWVVVSGTWALVPLGT